MYYREMVKPSLRSPQMTGNPACMFSVTHNEQKKYQKCFLSSPYMNVKMCKIFGGVLPVLYLSLFSGRSASACISTVLQGWLSHSFQKTLCRYRWSQTPSRVVSSNLCYPPVSLGGHLVSNDRGK